MAELKDSGARKKFSTGAVRDIHEGKGRCDLLPLEEVECLLNEYNNVYNHIREETATVLPAVLEWVDVFIQEGNERYLYKAMCRFIDDAFKADIYTALLELAKHYEDGAKKYSDNNWKLGIDLHCFIDSAVRHYLKWLRGDDDEPHARAVLWNLIGAIWTLEHKPELNDICRMYGSKGENIS